MPAAPVVINQIDGRPAIPRPSHPSSDLIFRYTDAMRTMTATEASRKFSELLDAIERGETIRITRGNRPIAEIGPARRRTGADLHAALAGLPPPDDKFVEDIKATLSLVTSEMSDPWSDD
jgi:prevent-host-death family protein